LTVPATVDRLFIALIASVPFFTHADPVFVMSVLSGILVFCDGDCAEVIMQ